MDMRVMMNMLICLLVAKDVDAMHSPNVRFIVRTLGVSGVMNTHHLLCHMYFNVCALPPMSDDDDEDPLIRGNPDWN